MFNNKWWLLAAVFVVGAVIYTVLKPKPIKIDAAPAQSRYSQCCRLASGELSCVDQAGEQLSYKGSKPAQEFDACVNNEKPSNKPDFSRHQILSANDALAASQCCAATAHTKRCALPNGHSFEMPLATTETNMAACP